MMGLRERESSAFVWIGLAALVGLGLLLWQRKRPPLLVTESLLAMPQARWDRALQAARRIDVNTADVAALERLPEVGPMLARRIVAFRALRGPFQTPEDLTHVPGIGPKTFSALQDYVTTETE